MNREKLLQMIDVKRKETITLGLTMGLNAIETVQSSQELDELLNELQREAGSCTRTPSA